MSNAPQRRPLPLRNGALFIDNSFLETWVDCPRKAEYQGVLRRSTGQTQAALNFGSAIHLALDYRYAKFGDLTPERFALCEAGQRKLLEEHFTTNPGPEGDHRDLNWAYELVQQYNLRYGYEPFNVLMKEGKPMVEIPFAVPFMAFDPETGDTQRILADYDTEKLVDSKLIPIIYSGKIDAAVLYDAHEVFVMDHKTGSNLGDAFWVKHRMNPQFYGYCWAWRALTGVMPTGFMVNAISTSSKPFTKPKTSWEEWWSKKFQRNREVIDSSHLDEWEENTFHLIKQFLTQWREGFFPQHRSHCAQFGQCLFYDVCFSLRSSREELIFGSGFVDYHWTPLGEHKSKFDLLEADRGSTGSETNPPVEGNDATP
jgi:hypothetical protein